MTKLSVEDFVWLARYNLKPSEREEFLRIQMPDIDISEGSPAYYLLYEEPYSKQYTNDRVTYFIWHPDNKVPDTTRPYKRYDKAIARAPCGSLVIEVPNSELADGFTNVQWHLCHHKIVPVTPPQPPSQVSQVEVFACQGS
jgi:hypothetical protein